MPADYDTVLTIYRAVIARSKDVQEKGKKNRYTSRNGHMTSFLSPEGQLCLRLSKPDLAAFLADHPGPPVTQYGAAMKEYAGVPEELLGDLDTLAGWFESSWSFVGGLKPK